MSNLKRLFGSEVITRYPIGLNAEQLKYKFSEHRLDQTVAGRFLLSVFLFSWMN